MSKMSKVSKISHFFFGHSNFSIHESQPDFLINVQIYCVAVVEIKSPAHVKMDPITLVALKPNLFADKDTKGPTI